MILVPNTENETRIHVEPGRRYLINPGSSGQPRDGDPRAAYATFDSETMDVTLYRVPYDVSGAQAKIATAGLPEELARRLALGK